MTGPDDDPIVEFPPTGDLTRAAAKSVFWSASQKWGSEALETVIFMVLARMVMPADFGLIALARVFVLLAQLVLDQGLESALVQRKDLRRSHLDTAFWTNLGFGVVLAAIGVACAQPVAEVLIADQDRGKIHPEELAGILRLLTISFVLGGACGLPNALLRRQLQYKSLAVRNWVASLSGGVVGIALAIAGYGAWSLAWMQVTIAVAGVPVLWLNCRYRPGLRVTRTAFRDLFAYGSNIMGYRLLTYASGQADRVLVGSILGAAQLGYYALGQRVSASLSRLFGQTIGHVALPAFSRVQDDRERLRRSYVSTIHLLCIVGVPAFFGVAATAQEVVVLAFGAKWIPSVDVVRALAVIEFLQAIVLVNSVVIMAIGRPGRLLALNAAATVAKVSALLLVGRRGIVFVALTCAVDVVVLLPVQIAMLRTSFGLGVGEVLSAAGRPLLAGVAMACAVLALAVTIPLESPVSRLLVLVPAGGAVYLAAILAIDRAGLDACRATVRSLLDRRRAS